MPFDLVPLSKAENHSDPLVQPEEREQTSRNLIACGAMVLLIVTGLMLAAGLSIELPADFADGAALTLVAALVLRSVLLKQSARRREVLMSFGGYVGLLALISLAGVIATYPIAAISRNYSDSLLLRGDAALHFDWVSWYRVIVAHPILQISGRIFYDSVFLTPLVICAHFAYFAERERAHLLIASYGLSVFLTLLLFAFFPARGPLATLWHGPIPYMPKTGLFQPILIDALKHHAIHEVRIDDLRGLVSVPSFHTTAAILFIVAAWPLRRIRWPVLIVNALMLASIPVEGTHYLTDMVAGMLVAMVSQGAASFLLSCTAPMREFNEIALLAPG